MEAENVNIPLKRSISNYIKSSFSQKSLRRELWEKVGGGSRGGGVDDFMATLYVQWPNGFDT